MCCVYESCAIVPVFADAFALCAVDWTVAVFVLSFVSRVRCPAPSADRHAELMRAIRLLWHSQDRLRVSVRQKSLRLIKFSELTGVSAAPIGEGATGSVVTATWNATKVAVKVTSEKSEDADALRREVELYDMIGRQGNVVTLYGVCTDATDGHLRLVMEYCSNGSLDKWLIRELRTGFADEKV